MTHGIEVKQMIKCSDITLAQGIALLAIILVLGVWVFVLTFRKPTRPTRRRIVCLCGSTRFHQAFQHANYDRTMAGDIVLSVGFAGDDSTARHGEKYGCTPKQKIKLDALHFDKIALADEVLVINVGGYIGDSTRREIAEAKRLGKPVYYRFPYFMEASEMPKIVCVGRDKP